ncbi:transglutaminase family protein [Halarcobacter sp.]|uniref:transglutaminase domain-containing protein n=1 Tax=Halarcobacter sp. TaxID=2321133 RepID=UPI0029F55B51|nr:transglutaminase family protein [Halarcobacter sp.]
MERRNFLKSSALLSTTVLINPSFAFAKTESNPFGIKDGFRKFTIKNDYKLEASNEVTQLWVPVPLTSKYQELVDIKFDGNYEKAEIVKNPYDTKVLYVKWAKSDKERVLNVTFDVITNQKSLDLSKADGKEIYSDEVKVFLEPTKHIPVTEKITALANDITKNAKTPLEKAQAIYDWTVTTMYRDNSVVGCGLGDAGKAIEEKIYGGKCTDISSVFVALLRNANIPAREVFGIRAGKSKISKVCGKADENGFAKITGGQHCRAEFFISGLGWVPADPADVTKVRLGEKLTNESEKTIQTKNFMFGSWEMNWVAFNYARDFVLNPKPAQYPLNMLGYPYAEVGEDAQNYYDPKGFAYSYTSQENK